MGCPQEPKSVLAVNQVKEATKLVVNTAAREKLAASMAASLTTNEH